MGFDASIAWSTLEAAGGDVAAAAAQLLGGGSADVAATQVAAGEAPSAASAAAAAAVGAAPVAAAVPHSSCSSALPMPELVWTVDLPRPTHGQMIGVHLHEGADGVATVATVDAGSLAEQGGLSPGDRLLAVAGCSAPVYQVQAVISMLHAQASSPRGVGAAGDAPPTTVELLVEPGDQRRAENGADGGRTSSSTSSTRRGTFGAGFRRSQHH